MLPLVPAPPTVTPTMSVSTPSPERERMARFVILAESAAAGDPAVVGTNGVMLAVELGAVVGDEGLATAAVSVVSATSQATRAPRERILRCMDVSMDQKSNRG